MFKSRVLLTSTALVCGLAAAAPAFAQNDQEDVIRVDGRYLSLDQLNAVKTPTPIIDVPQSLSIVSEVQIAEQGFANLGDILRYTPGLSISQGEGHRDAINIRGNQATGDFFLNGIRDDVQYYRPLYNLEQVEILRGSNALLFGRGGGGGVINRVTKSPVSGEDFTQASVSLDTFGAYQVTGDTNAVLTGTTAVRLNAFVEEMANHRDAFDGSRYGINPTLTTELGNETTLTLFYEYLNDDRVVDRGVPSVAYAGVPNRPLTGFDDFFFGSPEENNTTLEAHTFRARVEHEFTDQLRGNVTVQYADYDKAYQNLYAAGIDTSSTPNRVTLDGYRDTTTRSNLIVQGNLVGEFQTGIFSHTFLVGGEYGDQETANARWDNVFAANNDDRIEIDVTDPLSIPDFSFSAPARDRQSEVSFASLYVQDQIDVTDTFKVVLGARLDRFDVSVLDLRAVSATDDGRRGRVDEEISPRFGLIYKPAENVSVYASYSETFLPSAGDQFLTLSTTTEDIRPQVFENREIGAKWDVNDRLSFTAALFRLERGQFTTVDPDDASIVTTVAGSTTEGFELQLIGELLDGWTINAGYSWLDGEVEGGGSDGNVTRQTPEHMLSVWNRYQVNDRLALALGATYQDSFFVLEDNSVEVPDYLRFDAAVYYDLSDTTRIQLNVENLTDEDYFPDAHSNSNISTGEPTNARLTLHHRF
ncbi:MAG: TonB-dependent siderophore receptor [Alphaproteobacteria bacterium]|uniref:TonB-dependent receptor n=1 Tax=Maricaulis alexandrii TaxID=2570354 RepID=UPI001109E313|nr:TonB-dependent siderophore receptor [Maricaulis alexandrii]MCR9266112.1 TonB-dependent siderophore receptor [Alphaproteobacteria bacterium]